MKQEVRRGRKFVEYHDPDTQDEHTFTQEISCADVSYQDEQGRWQQLVEDWETDGQDGFSFRASRMNHKVRFDSIGAWRWYPRRNVETEYLVLNRPQCWLTATKRWGNLLVNGISREGKDITLTSVRNVTRVIHSRWNGIKTDWILLNANAPTRFRQKIDLVGITEIEGVLFGADGVELGRLTPTTATDANGAELPCSGSFANGYVEFQANVTGAVYPVTIDPDFTGGTGDGYAVKASSSYASAHGGSGAISDQSELRIGQYGTYWYIYRAGVLFDTSSIGSGSTITQVNLKVYVNNIGDATNNDLIIKKCNWTGTNGFGDILAADADDAILFNYADGTGEKTSGNLSTAWVNKTGTTYYGLIAENDNNNSSADYAYCKINAADAASGKPVLTVTYTAAGGFHPINMTAQMQSLTGGMRS